jgi:hypothetical protein
MGGASENTAAVAGTTLQQSIFDGPHGVKRPRKDSDVDEIEKPVGKEEVKAVTTAAEEDEDDDEEGSAMEESDDD